MCMLDEIRAKRDEIYAIARRQVEFFVNSVLLCETRFAARVCGETIAV